MLPINPVWSVSSGLERQIANQIRAVLNCPPELRAEIAELDPRGNVSAGPVDELARRGFPVSRSGEIALVELVGPMMKSTNAIERFFGFTSTLDVERSIRAADADDDVSQIVLAVDSPGGSVAGIAELADAIRAARKPIIAQSLGMIASAAYYISAAADSIVAQRMDLIGSIGVRTVLYDFSAMLESEGVEAVVVDTGEHKSTGVFGAPITEAQRAEVQRVIDGYFEDFLNVVQAGRQLPRNALVDLADGRVFFAAQAVENGLIDGLSTLDDTVRRLQAINRTNTREARRALYEFDAR